MATSNNQTMQSPSRPSQDSPSEDAAKDEKLLDKGPPDKRPSLPSRIWMASGLNLAILKMMVKGALPPTIALAIYQSNPVAKEFTTIGYLIAIESVLSFAILPRAKFIQTMLLNTIAVCFGAAVALLGIYCSVQARLHTTPHKPQAASPASGGIEYNSSDSAVSAIWLFFSIFFANTVRASRPQLQFPVIMYSIFTDVAFTYSPTFPTMAYGISFVKRLMEAFLTGFAIATGVSLFIFPTSVRDTFFKQSAGYIGALQGALKAQISYLQSLEKEDMFRPWQTLDNGNPEGETRKPTTENATEPLINSEAQKLKAAIAGIGELHGKMHADLSFAKRETAWGKLDASDIDEMFNLFQQILFPLTGMSSAADVFQRVAERWGWTETKGNALHRSLSAKEHADEARLQWNDIMRSLHDPFQAMMEAMVEGLQHSLYALELVKMPKKPKTDERINGSHGLNDIEADAGVVKPGDPRYSVHLAKQVDHFYEQRKSTLAVFCQQRGINLDAHKLENPSESDMRIRLESTNPTNDAEVHKRNKRQLFLVLYMQFLLWSTGQSVLHLAQFADRKAEEGLMKKRRLIFPGTRILKKWAANALKAKDANAEQAPDSAESGGTAVYSGQSFHTRKDPEHLPATNTWQRVGNGIRMTSKVLGSAESAFGLRVACATLSIGIVNYLEVSHTFFLEQRLVWGMIMVSIGMTTTAGSGVFGFLGRIAGTTIAMCASLVCWYIVDGHSAGVLVFLCVFVFIETYFLIKYPRFTIITLISIVSQVLIIGYELEVKMVGRKVATSNGQPYYPIYELAPYRLACVSGGMFVAFIWTFFPYPLTARSKLRKDLGASIYLLANFYSVVHTTIGVRIKGTEGDLTSKTSPGRKLAKARHKVFVKELTLLASLRQHSAFTAWEPTLGGKFPKQQYDVIIQEVSNILNYLALVSYTSRAFSHDPTDSPDKESWIQDFSRLVGSIQATSQEITSTLALLSAAVTNGHPLPPYLKKPESYQLSAKLEALDSDILSVKHIAEPGYSAFAVMQIASSLVSDDMGKLIDNVKALVGEVDFSFHAISTAQDSAEALLLKDTLKGKKE